MKFKDKWLAIVSAIMIVPFGLGLLSELDNYKIQKNGKEIHVRIVDVPRTCSESSKYSKAYFRFEYLGKIHIKDLIGSQCEYVLSNDIIILKTDNENSSFLFQDEDVTTEIVSCSLLILTMIIFIFIGLRKKKTESLIARQGNYKKEKKPRQPKMGRYGSKI